MAANPISPANDTVADQPLTREEGWALLWSLEGSMKDWFPEEGGASGVLEKEREAWGV
jgi:hypothetical protein